MSNISIQDTVEYSYVPTSEVDMGISIRLFDADGNSITDVSAQTWETCENRYRQQMELQSLDAIPDPLVLEVKNSNGEVIGSCVCKVADTK